MHGLTHGSTSIEPPMFIDRRERHGPFGDPCPNLAPPMLQTMRNKFLTLLLACAVLSSAKGMSVVVYASDRAVSGHVLEASPVRIPNERKPVTSPRSVTPTRAVTRKAPAPKAVRSEPVKPARR